MKRSFIHSGERWPGQFPTRRQVIDEVIVSVDSGDGTLTEFSAEWFDVSSVRQTPGRLCRVGVTDDCWSMYATCSDLFEWLACNEARGECITPEAFCDMLREYEFVDQTAPPVVEEAA